MKKNIINCLLSLILCLTCTLIFQQNSFALSQKVSNPYPLLNGIDSIIDGGTINIHGTKNTLYKVFDNPSNAINDLKNIVPEILNTLSQNFDLEPICDANWKEYQDAMYILLDSDSKPTNYNESNIQFRTLRSFFDIYENQEKNETILNKYETTDQVYKKNVSQIGELLPYFEPAAQNFIAEITFARAALNIDVAAAVDYAQTYATSPNTPRYHRFNNGDCTNFVSQILENAGVKQVVYDSEYSGWWHTRTSGFLGLGYNHKHSRSWTMADTFCRYMGVGYTTTSNVLFAENIVAGCCIAADFDSDGDWDHMGFITHSDLSAGSYGYRDYRVAQHTPNYIAWASTTNNNWEVVGSDGGTYARVRS